MQPKEMVIEMEVEKKPVDVKEGEMGMDESKEDSMPKSPEEVMSKVLSAGSPAEALKYLEECGFELTQKKSEEEKPEEEEPPMDMGRAIDRIESIKKRIARKAAMESK